MQACKVCDTHYAYVQLRCVTFSDFNLSLVDILSCVCKSRFMHVLGSPEKIDLGLRLHKHQGVCQWLMLPSLALGMSG